MRRLRANRLPIAAFAAGTLLAAWLGQRKSGPTTPGAPPDDWDIPRLVAFLDERGLGLRSVPTLRDGGPHETAFLTTTAKGWADLNRLPKDPGRIARWRGTLYCERGPGGEDWSDLARQWGDYCLVAGPFLFFGDPELLARVRAALDTLA